MILAVRAVVQICETSFTDMEECSWSMKSVSYPADLARRDDVNGGDDFDFERLSNFSRARVHLEDTHDVYSI